MSYFGTHPLGLARGLPVTKKKARPSPHRDRCSGPPSRQRCAPTALALALLALCAGGVAAAPGDLVGMIPARFPAPQGIAFDRLDGTFWVTSFLENEIVHYSGDLQTRLGTIPIPYEPFLFSFAYGIAHNTIDDTLFVVDSFSGNVHEVRRDGEPTGRVIAIPYPEDSQSPGSLAFHAGGNGGAGSLFVVESGDGLIVEFTLDGELLRSLPALDDPDRYFGLGNNAHPFAFDLRYEDEELVGFLVASTTAGLLELDIDGNYTGRWTSLDAAGAQTSAVVRQTFPDPTTGTPRDALVCVVGTEARFAILEPGFETFSSVTRFRVEQEGRDIRLAWALWQDFDAVEVLRDCEVIDVLPGDAMSWAGRIDDVGVHELSVRAIDDGVPSSSETATVVIGAGQILREFAPESGTIFDLAADGSDTLIVTDPTARVFHVFDGDLNLLRSAAMSSFFVPEGDSVGGIAVDSESRTLFLFNQSSYSIGLFDVDNFTFIGSLDALLPDRDAIDREQPFIGGMTFRPGAGADPGTLLLVELVRHVIFEVDLAGNVVQTFDHPYLALEELPDDPAFGPSVSGIAMVAGGRDAVLLSAALFREGGQQRVLRFDLGREELIRGFEVPTAALAGSRFGLEQMPGTDGAPRLFLTSNRRRLFEVDAAPLDVPAPSLLECAQVGLDNDVELRFELEGEYDEIEVSRDCADVTLLAGDATTFVDREVDPGIREYSVRARANGTWSPSVRCRLRVGPGAVVDRSLTFPVINPRHFSRDPVDGMVFMSGKVRDEEGELGVELIHRFTPELEFAETLPPPVEFSLRLETFAVRHAAGEQTLLYFIVHSITAGTYTVVAKAVGGAFVDQYDIEPPLPDEPFPSAPVGLVWAPETDTFFYLERNSATFVEMAPGGEVLRTFAHPAPPPNHFFSNVGIGFSAERGALYAPTVTDVSDVNVGFTRIVEIDLATGALTGGTMPISPRRGLGGFTAVGETLFGVSTSPFDEFLSFKLSAEVPAVLFVRGDANLSGRVELSDPVALLNFLFQGASVPPCRDGADSNDDGTMNITDAIFTLTFLFLGGPQPPAPFPEPGSDLTPDDLDCVGL